MKCPECNDTRVYLGLGTAPPEPCRACQPQSAATSPSFYPVGHVPVSSGSRNEFRSQAKMPSFRPLWHGFEFGRSVIPADVGGPMNLIPSSDTDTTKLSFSSLSDGQYLVRDGSGIVECRVPKVNDNGSVKSDTFPKSDPITDAELQKLIDQAVKSGQNLDALIKGRTLANDGVPPVITLRVTY